MFHDDLLDRGFTAFEYYAAVQKCWGSFHALCLLDTVDNIWVVCSPIHQQMDVELVTSIRTSFHLDVHDFVDGDR